MPDQPVAPLPLAKADPSLSFTSPRSSTQVRFTIEGNFFGLRRQSAATALSDSPSFLSATRAPQSNVALRFAGAIQSRLHPALQDRRMAERVLSRSAIPGDLHLAAGPSAHFKLSKNAANNLAIHPPEYHICLKCVIRPAYKKLPHSPKKLKSHKLLSIIHQSKIPGSKVHKLNKTF
jgi:hypothetical protein